ncbi:acyltransferase [Echinimonas agarilytica]|uniref:Acyltransferase n=1 Tax=Echinimonas agarilytica TaxID=1215918 RepID=A0AA41W7Y4_9GAMM|nr:acyltransferase [Echinimonas agarilytica]MCM2680117.1 acyltransferase [Echinimonas agarilytica]
MKKIYYVLLGLPKSLFFNFYYFSFATAIKFPVILSHRVWLKTVKGSVSLPSDFTKRITLGFGDCSIFDKKVSRTIWNVTGDVVFLGSAKFGHGSKLSIDGKLIVGDNLNITAESSIVSSKSVSIGSNVLISWDVLIMDTDFHKIYTVGDSRQTNCPKPITIGDNCWIGCNTVLLKGTELPYMTIVGSSSVVSKKFQETNCLVVGNPANIVRRDVEWQV